MSGPATDVETDSDGSSRASDKPVGPSPASTVQVATYHFLCLHDELLVAAVERMMGPRGLLHALGLDDSMYVSITGEVCLPMTLCAILVPCAVVGAFVVPFYIVYLALGASWRSLYLEQRFYKRERVVRWRAVQSVWGLGHEKVCTAVFSGMVILFAFSSLLLAHWEIQSWRQDFDNVQDRKHEGLLLTTWNLLSEPAYSVWLGMSVYECIMLLECVMAHLVFEFFENEIGKETDGRSVGVSGDSRPGEVSRNLAKIYDNDKVYRDDKMYNDTVHSQPLPFSRRSLRHIVRTLNFAFIMDLSRSRTGHLFPDLVMLNDYEDEDTESSSSSSSDHDAAFENTDSDGDPVDSAITRRSVTVAMESKRLRNVERRRTKMMTMEAQRRARAWSNQKRRDWVATIAGLRRIVFETTWSPITKVVILGIALSRLLLHMHCFRRLLFHSSDGQQCGEQAGHTKMDTIVVIADSFSSFVGAFLPFVVLYSRYHLLNNAHLRMIVMLFICTPSAARCRTYITYRKWLKPIGMRRLMDDVDDPSDWGSKFTESQVFEDAGKAVWLRNADPMLLRRRGRGRTPPKDNLLKMCFVLFRRKHLQLDPDGKTWEERHPNHKQHRTREHIDTLRSNMQSLEFSSLDASAFLNVRTWMLIDVTMERVRMQHTIIVLGGVIFVEFLQLTATLWIGAEGGAATDSTLRAVWHFFVEGVFLALLVNAAAGMNQTMRDRMVLMLRYWKTRTMKVALRSHNVELPRSALTDWRNAPPPIFLTDFRVQVDNHLRVIQDGLEFLISMIERQEQPISMFGFEVSYKLHSSVMALVTSVVVSFVWKRYEAKLKELLQVGLEDDALSASS